MCAQTETFRTYSNDKPWFTPNLMKLRQTKEEAYRCGDQDLYKQARNRLTKEIRVAMRSYSEKLKNSFSANNSVSVRRDLRHVINYRRPSPHLWKTSDGR